MSNPKGKVVVPLLFFLLPFKKSSRKYWISRYHQNGRCFFFLFFPKLKENIATHCLKNICRKKNQKKFSEILNSGTTKMDVVFFFPPKLKQNIATHCCKNICRSKKSGNYLIQTEFSALSVLCFTHLFRYLVCTY